MSEYKIKMSMVSIEATMSVETEAPTKTEVEALFYKAAQVFWQTAVLRVLSGPKAD